MAEREVQRRLAAILAADVAGYTSLMEEDTDGTVAAWQDAREDVIKPGVTSHSGKVVKLTGDGFLVEFPTVQDAVNCAINLQQELVSSSLNFRMGVNLGDIIDDGEDIHGEGVNVAARLEGLAEPGGIVISGGVFDQIRNRIDAEYRDMGPQEVKNVSAPVQAYEVKIESVSGSIGVNAPVSDKPSIAVLPFDNLSGDPEQEYFSDGISEDIITALSRVRQLFVIARNTTFTFKGKAVDVQATANELGVRYVLEGSVRKAGNMVRITTQLIDGETGNHIWAEKYDRELEDIFAVQDEITETVIRAIEPELGRAERERARKILPENLDAWTALQKGIFHYYEARLDAFEEALKLFDRAIELDPNFALGYTWSATLMVRRRIFGFDEYDKDKAYSLAQRAVELDPSEPDAHLALGYCHYSAGEQDTALEEFEEVLRINPNHEQALHFRGRVLSVKGRHEDAIDSIQSAIKASPRDNLIGAFYALLSLSHLLLRDHEEAIVWGAKSVRFPYARFAPAILLSALGHAGKTDDAKAALSELQRVRPEFSISYLRGSFMPLNESDMNYFLDGLTKGGLPENL